MGYNANTTTKTTSIPVGLLMGLGAACLATIMSAAIFTCLIAGQQLEETALAPASVITILLSTFVGAMVSAGKVGKRRLIVCVCSGGFYFLSLLCCNILFFEGQFRGLPAAILVVLGSSTVAGLLGLRQKGQKFKYAPKGRKR